MIRAAILWLRPRFICSGLIAIHIVLVARLCFLYSPTIDEVAYLPAGLSHWEQQHFALARINPPLARMVAAVPLLFVDKETNWQAVNFNSAARSEHAVGQDFAAANGERTFYLFSLARLACLPFSLIALYFLFCWSKELYGNRAAIAALSLWCISPNILGHGALVSPDICSLATGVATLYSFRRWIQIPTYYNAILCGLWLGLAQLARTTWLILYPLLFFIWLIFRFAPKEPNRPSIPWPRDLLGIVFLFLLSLSLLNFGYGFSGTFTRYEDYKFRSKVLSCNNSGGGVCLKHILPGSFPIPLPSDYLYGVDTQKLSFENSYVSFFGGEFIRGGSWDYYLRGLLVKLPLGTLLLFGLASSLIVFRKFGTTLRWEEVFLIVPVIALSAFVSSQTGINQHVRYIFPILPFIFIFTCRIFAPTIPRPLQQFALSLLLLAAGESLLRYPNHLSFFNIAAGGPSQGPFLMNYSNLDWGQDLQNLADWKKDNAEKELKLVYFGNFDPSIAGIGNNFRKPYFTRLFYSNAAFDVTELSEGYYALSVQFLQHMQAQLLNKHPEKRYRANVSFYGFLLAEEPFAKAGQSIFIYHLDKEKIASLRRQSQKTS